MQSGVFSPIYWYPKERFILYFLFDIKVINIDSRNVVCPYKGLFITAVFIPPDLGREEEFSMYSCRHCLHNLQITSHDNSKQRENHRIIGCYSLEVNLKII